MVEKEFNLIDEPWILVMKPDGMTCEVSLKTLFREAHLYRCLAGELPTQDIAMLRLLLAILHAVVARYTPEGEYVPLETAEQALQRWKTIWDAGSFPVPLLEKYLDHFSDKFFLFHPTRPFWQSAGLQKGTKYPVAKLIGTMAESSNKIRLFPQRTGVGKQTVSYGEAARWLLHVNGYDDTSSKPTLKGLPSPGAGWLGKLGLVVAAGENLFETLCLNLVLLPNGESTIWAAEGPAWELDTYPNEERVEIPQPDNPSALYTLQSRRLLLQRNGHDISNYLLLGGDFFPKENMFTEQMTVWKYEKTADDSEFTYRPRRHDPSRRMWRDFSSIISEGEGKRRPGVVNWVTCLKSNGLLHENQVRFETAAVHYGDKDFFIDDAFADTLSLNGSLLLDQNDNWRFRILAELDITKHLVESLGYLAKELAIAAGSRNPDGERLKAMELGYHRLDVLFPTWLAAIEPDHDEKDITCDRWWKTAQGTIRILGKELVEECGSQAYAGRTVAVEEKRNGKSSAKGTKAGSGKKERFYSVPSCYQSFLVRTSNRDTLRKGETNA